MVKLQGVRDIKLIELSQLEHQVSVILLSKPDLTTKIETLQQKIRETIASYN